MTSNMGRTTVRQLSAKAPQRPTEDVSRIRSAKRSRAKAKHPCRQNLSIVLQSPWLGSRVFGAQAENTERRRIPRGLRRKRSEPPSGGAGIALDAYPPALRWVNRTSTRRGASFQAQTKHANVLRFSSQLTIVPKKHRASDPGSGTLHQIALPEPNLASQKWGGKKP